MNGVVSLAQNGELSTTKEFSNQVLGLSERWLRSWYFCATKGPDNTHDEYDTILESKVESLVMKRKGNHDNTIEWSTMIPLIRLYTASGYFLQDCKQVPHNGKPKYLPSF
jgi:hypothetical protein